MDRTVLIEFTPISSSVNVKYTDFYYRCGYDHKLPHHIICRINHGIVTSRYNQCEMIDLWRVDFVICEFLSAGFVVDTVLLPDVDPDDFVRPNKDSR